MLKHINCFFNLYFSKKIKMINTVNKVLQESISLTKVLANSEEIKVKFFQ